MDYYLGEIRMFAGNFAPQGWALCNGAVLRIADYEALYSLLGTVWGGDGQTTFGLPDLRGRLPVGQGQGPSLALRVLGQKGGSEAVGLSEAQLPIHSHAFNAAKVAATTDTLGSSVVLAQPVDDDMIYLADSTTGAILQQYGAGSIAECAGGQSHTNIMPSLAVNFIIAVTLGTYPQRP